MHFYYIMLTFWLKASKTKYTFCHHQQYVKNPSGSIVIYSQTYLTLPLLAGNFCALHDHEMFAFTLSWTVEYSGYTKCSALLI
jgi:hypothetical protein